MQSSSSRQNRRSSRSSAAEGRPSALSGAEAPGFGRSRSRASSAQVALGETEPLLQLYAMPQGVRGELWSSDCQRVPPAPLLRVVCYLEPLADDGPDAPPVELARTEVRHTADPLFTEPLELWDEASGRGGSRTLRFEVQDGAVMHGVDAQPPVALAIATAASDALRRAGRSGSVMQGVALALPLRTPAGKALPGGRLHLYVHAGDGVRDLAQAQAQAQA